MNSIKERGYDIVKLVVNQIGIAIFAMMLYSALDMVDLGASKLLVRVLISVFSIGFYFVLLYTATWDMGAKDKIRVDGGRLASRPGLGFLMGLFANIGNFVLGALCVVTYWCYLAGVGEGFKTAFGLINLVFRFLTSMYLGSVIGIFNGFAESEALYLYQSFGLFVFPVLAVAVSGVGYLFGLNNRKLFGGK